jgi:hypothetical protein
MPTDMTPAEVKAFLEGGTATPDAVNTWPRPNNPPRFGVDKADQQKHNRADSVPVNALLNNADPTMALHARVGDGIGTARERAKLNGWSIECELTNGSPHELNGCQCRHRRITDEHQRGCQCPCHGRSVVHYKRGA